MKRTITFDLTWIIVLFVILKVLGLIHCSWLWILVPVGFVALFGLLGAVLGLLGASLALWALKNYKVKIKLDKSK